MADGLPALPAVPSAEQSLLGGLLLRPESMADAVDGLSPDDFAVARHGVIFEAMVAIWSGGDRIDVVLLADELKKRGALAQVGGPEYLDLLDACVPSSGNLRKYADIVRRASFRARARKQAAHLLELADDESLSADALAEQVEAATATLLDRRETSDGTVTLGESVRRVYQTMEAAYEAHLSGRVTGSSTGFAGLDAMTCGLHAGDLVIVAGRPSMGKTALALQIALNVARSTNVPAVAFSLEMEADALTRRIVSAEASVDASRIRSGALDDVDWPKLARASERIHRVPLLVNDSPAPTVLDVRARCRRLKMKHKALSLIMVDYIGLVKGSAVRGKSREQEVAEVSKGLKALAREMNCPVIALSQLNRDCEKRPDKRPMLSDLRESGGIEQDADLIVLLYREEYYQREKTAPEARGIAEAIIAKQRNGSVGTVRLGFRPEFTRFHDIKEER